MILAAGTGAPADSRLTVRTVSLADAWEHNATDWIAWARAPDPDGFWDGTWPALLEILPDSAGLTLDVSCKKNQTGQQLLAAGWRVLGIEPSATLARAAATGSPALPVAHADAARLPLADTRHPGVMKIVSTGTASASPWPACTGRSARIPRRCSGRAW